MPLHPDYHLQIRSQVADIINSTPTKSAGACTAAAFLSYFVPESIPWMHMDIAGIFHTGSTVGMYEKGMTGTSKQRNRGMRTACPALQREPLLPGDYD